MPVFPLKAFQQVSSANPWTYLVFGLIGFAFGFVLESSGFGNSRKLAAQFYFKDLTVLKVMFGAIVTAMVLLFTASGMGILDFNQVWVNPTYLWPGILGGLIMGIGFIIGGFCPGTSVVAAATGKLDGLFFLLGGFFGAFLFGETEKYFDQWWNTSGYYGRLLLPEVFGLPTGVVVILIVLMALFMFWGAEQLERIFGQRDLSREPKMRMVGALFLLVFAALTIVLGQPSLEEKYARIAPQKEPLLQNREVYVSPAEVFHTIHKQYIRLVLLDVRPDVQYNLYHIRGAENVPLEQIPAYIRKLLAYPPSNTVYVVISNDEKLSTQAWKMLVAGGVPNVYILEGGLNNWLAVFGKDDPQIKALSVSTSAEEELRYFFPAALGDRYQSAAPSPIKYEELEYEEKIKLELKRDKSGGGCG
jgi:hypothetical protein